jgi:hypothetical protein
VRNPKGTTDAAKGIGCVREIITESSLKEGELAAMHGDVLATAREQERELPLRGDHAGRPSQVTVSTGEI